MLKHLISICLCTFFNVSYAQTDTLKYYGDIEFSQGNFEIAINFYETYGYTNLNSNQLSRLIYAQYMGDKLSEIDTSVDVWIKQGVMPVYIKSVLKYRYKNMEPFLEDTLFKAEKMVFWNKKYGSVVAQSPNEFYSSNKFMLHDQHLRFVEINSQKKVDHETFLRADSLNMIAIMDYLKSNVPQFKKTTDEILFGVIHHYCSESFFSKKHYEFFDQKMLELIDNGVLDVFDYCYFVDKYRVFNGINQKYGTYKEMEGIVGVTTKEYEKINVERLKIGLYLKIEDQIKYGLF